MTSVFIKYDKAAVNFLLIHSVSMKIYQRRRAEQLFTTVALLWDRGYPIPIDSLRQVIDICEAFEQGLLSIRSRTFEGDVAMEQEFFKQVGLTRYLVSLAKEVLWQG
ncbi:hypothetical protein ACPV5S_19315 [Vibrio astriarenae]